MSARSLFLPLLLWLALAGLPGWAAPGRVEFFVRNQAFSGEVRVLRGEVYAALDDLMQALDLSWEVQEDRLMAWSRPGGGPALDGEPLRLVLDGRILLVHQEAFAGRLFVALAGFSSAVGGRYSWNPQSGMADYFPRMSSAAGQRLRTDGRGGNGSALRLREMSYLVEKPEDSPQRVLRGYAVVANAGPRPLEDLVLEVEVRDAQGAVRGGFSWQVRRLDPGAELTWQFPLWLDFEQVTEPHPVLHFEHR